MGRKRLDDGKRATICAKVSEADIARIDAARGDLTRSAWVQRAIGVVLGTVPLSEALPATAAASAIPASAIPASPRQAPARPRATREPRPKTGMCEHRVPAGAYCKRCTDA